MNPKKMRTKKNEKLKKFLTRSGNGANRPDLSNLRKPIDTSVSDLYQVSDLLEDGTDEIKSLLSYECDVIYECRICRSLYRSVANFVSHKREYCREKFDVAHRKRGFNKYNAQPARESILRMYKTEQTSNNEVKNDRILRSQVLKESNKKDLTSIIDMLDKKREEYIENQLENENVISNVPDDRHIYLEPIDTNNSAAYQTVESDPVIGAMDLMKEQVIELQNMDQNVLTVEEQTSDSPVEKSDSPIQANMSDEENESLMYRLSMDNDNLSCSICNAKFATKKTLTVHIKTHMPKRLCYPCPCCTNTFANTWSVYRHLHKVHKKTTEQVRKLRSQIQEKAFHRKTTAMRDTKNGRAAKVSTLKNVVENSDKTQEPINHIESRTKLCGRRGRRSSKKASLPTHVEYCQIPIAACDEKTIRIKRCNTSDSSISDNIQYETDDNLVPNMIIKSSVDEVISSKNSECASSEICDHETSIGVQDVSNLSKEDWNMLGNQHDHLSELSSVDNNNDPDITSPDDSELLLSLAESQDDFVSDENLTPPVSNHDSEKRLTDSKERDNIEVGEDNSELQSSTRPDEKDLIFQMERKITTIANFQKLRCLSCKRKFTSTANLRRHVAAHIGWNRYRCKMCDFKCFVKCDCVAHCKKMHNMQNNRTIIEMILEISQDEYMCNENIIADVTGLKTKSDNPDITADVTASPCQPETCVNFNSPSDLDTHVISQSEAIVVNEQVAESRGSTECQNVDTGDSDKMANARDQSECMMNRRKLDDDPELKRMVMEVIFGTSNTSATEAQADSDKPVLETNDDASGHAFCPILNNAKHRRPTRNRIKPLSDDFIYDLKEVGYRKESALSNDSETLHIRKKTKLY